MLIAPLLLSADCSLDCAHPYPPLPPSHHLHHPAALRSATVFDVHITSRPGLFFFPFPSCDLLLFFWSRPFRCFNSRLSFRFVPATTFASPSIEKTFVLLLSLFPLSPALQGMVSTAIGLLQSECVSRLCSAFVYCHTPSLGTSSLK